jgi:host factor-I protein
MEKNQVNIQDQFLNRIRRDRIRVTLELTQGRTMEGIVLSFDNFSLLFRGESDQLIYKHAIASISVAGRMNFEATGTGPSTAVSKSGPKDTL